MKKNINLRSIVIFSIIIFSCFSFLYLNHLGTDSLNIEQGIQSFNTESGQVRQLIPDLFIIDNIIDNLKDLITIDF